LASAHVVPPASSLKPGMARWNNDDSRGARAQGRPSNRKSERYLRGRRAAGVHGPGGNDQTACAHVCCRFLAICYMKLQNLYLDLASIRKTFT